MRQCFFFVVVDPIVVVPVVPDVVVAVVCVPVVSVAVVAVVIVPDVSVLVPDGIAEVEVAVLPLVSVDIVLVLPVVSLELEVVIDVSLAAVSVFSLFFLHETANSARAAMVRRTRNVFFILSPLDECFSVKLISNSVVVASGLPALTSFPLDVFPFGKKTVRFVGGGGVGQRTTTPEETQQHKCQK